MNMIKDKNDKKKLIMKLFLFFQVINSLIKKKRKKTKKIKMKENKEL